MRLEGPEAEVLSALEAIDGVRRVEALRFDGQVGEYRVASRASSQVGGAIFRAAADRRWTLSVLEPESRSLEEVYLRLTETQPAAVAG